MTRLTRRAEGACPSMSWPPGAGSRAEAGALRIVFGAELQVRAYRRGGGGAIGEGQG
jgi:hypothetical protein